MHEADECWKGMFFGLLLALAIALAWWGTISAMVWMARVETRLERLEAKQP